MICSCRRILPFLCIAGLPVLGACPGTTSLDDDEGPVTSSTTSSESSADDASATASSDSGTTTVDPDGGTGSTTAGDESTGTTGAGVDDPGCPECMVLADGLAGGRGVAVDLDYVYFTDQDSGTVHRVHKGGGDGGPIAIDQEQPYDIAVSGDQVYWTNFVAGGGVWSAPADGGGVQQLVHDEDYPRALVVDGDEIFWGTFESDDGRVMHMTVGQAGPATSLAELFGGVADLVVEGDQVFFTAHTVSTGGGFIEPPDPLGSVFVATIGGDPFFPDQIATNLAQPWGIGKQGDTVAWANGTSPGADMQLSVLSVSAGGGPIQALASNQDAPWGIAVDEQYVYWTDHDTVHAVPLGGGDDIVLAEQQNQARSIVVDDQWVFWITRNRVLQRPTP